jgi:tetratricopeptide (TPR) repeat protein
MSPAAETAGERALLAITAVCLALRVAGSVSSSGWVWGLNTLRDWPWPWPAALPALAALAFVPALARAARRPLERAGDSLANSRVVVPMFLVAGVGLALYALRDPLLFTGDSEIRAGFIPLKVVSPSSLTQISPLDLLLNVRAARGLFRAGLDARDAQQLVGVLVGGAFTLGTLAFLRASGARAAACVAALCLVLGGGSLVHVAGYDKYGPLLVGIVLSAAGLVQLAREGRGSGTLAVGLIVALLSHRSAYALLPAGLWACAAAWRRAAREERVRLAWAAAAVLVVALGLLPHTVALLLRYDVNVNVVGLSTAGRVEPGRQVANVLNALFFLSPIWPVGAVAAWHVLRRGPGSARDGFPLAGVAALALVGELAIMLATRGGQGPLRDWDNQVGAALVVTLATAYALVAWWRPAGAVRAAAPICATALVASLALWGIHSDPGIGARRVATVLADRTAWNAEEWSRAHEFVGTHAFAAGRFDEAARAYEIAVSGAPTSRLIINWAVALDQAGRREEGRRALARAMAIPQPASSNWMSLAQLARSLDDSARAIVCVDSALAHDPGRADARELARALHAASARSVGSP